MRTSMFGLTPLRDFVIQFPRIPILWKHQQDSQRSHSKVTISKKRSITKTSNKKSNKMVHPKQEEYNKGKDAVPETRGVSEGSAKRIITRKHNPYDKADKKNHGGGGGKGNWDDLDDGSMDVYDEVAAPTDVSP